MSDPNDDLTTQLKEAALAAARIAVELDPTEAVRRGTQLRHRARIRRWVLSSTVALGVVVIFLVPLPHLLLRHQSTRPGVTTSTRPGVTTSTRPSTTTSTNPSNLASECASSASDCLPYPAAMTFADSTHGLMLVETCLPTVCRASVEISSDGGTHWQPRSSFVSFPPSDLVNFPGYPDSNPNQHGVNAIDLADAVDGWAYGPGLFVTHDGGRQFHRIKVQASVIAVAAAAGTVWVLEQRCFLKHELNECARSVLLTGPIGGDTLTPVANQPPGFPLAQGYSPGAQFPTVIVHPGVDLVVLASVSGLDVSTDAGRTWHQEPYPCRSPDVSSEGRTVSADPSGSLWLVCTGQIGGGFESKELWRSFNGGQSWLGPYSLPSGGYGGVIAATSTVAWAPWNRAPIYHSTDGGHSWHPLLTSHFNGAFGAPAAFSDVGSDDAWAIDPIGEKPFPRTLYRTTNGGRSWSTVRLNA